MYMQASQLLAQSFQVSSLLLGKLPKSPGWTLAHLTRLGFCSAFGSRSHPVSAERIVLARIVFCACQKHWQGFLFASSTGCECCVSFRAARVSCKAENNVAKKVAAVSAALPAAIATHPAFALVRPRSQC